MEIRVRVLPEEGFSGEGERRLWDEAFGGLPKEELDTFIFGEERSFNTEVLFSGEEEGRVVATCHVTIDKRTGLGGFGEVAVAASCRGRGLGRVICEAGLRYFDEAGGRAIFLATGNPAAAGLYASLGFAFLPGACVMLRCADSQIRFFNGYFRGGDTTIERGNASFRIPVIPLALFRHGIPVLDANVPLFGCDCFPQGSCMSLYPQYRKFLPDDLFVARGKKGEIAGAGTLRRSGGRCFADLFCHKNYPGTFGKLAAALRDAAGEPVRIPALGKEKLRLLAEETRAVRDGEITISARAGFSAAAELYRL